MRLSQIISILATFTALTGAFFLVRENTTMAMKAFGFSVYDNLLTHRGGHPHGPN
jgi:predicted ABC-type sugar transport system permease subunit